jgi:hypothetical protein
MHKRSARRHSASNRSRPPMPRPAPALAFREAPVIRTRGPFIKTVSPFVEERERRWPAMLRSSRLPIRSLYPHRSLYPSRAKRREAPCESWARLRRLPDLMARPIARGAPFFSIRSIAMPSKFFKSAWALLQRSSVPGCRQRQRSWKAEQFRPPRQYTAAPPRAL